jgi:predicted O-methyltransferase YrrM
MSSADLWAKKILVQYAVVRAIRPETIVETGVASGVSSAHLLLALERNQKGTLHSVEIGDSAYLPAGKEPGWIVPDWLRSRWQLYIGDVVAILPRLLRELGEVDIFIHDSLHTYEHMKFEFELGYPHVKKGGLLLADDALWNSAFQEFAQAVSSPASAIIRGVGFMKI